MEAVSISATLLGLELADALVDLDIYYRLMGQHAVSCYQVRRSPELRIVVVKTFYWLRSTPIISKYAMSKRVTVYPNLLMMSAWELPCGHFWVLTTLRFSLTSQPYFSSGSCALGRGRGKGMKIRLVTYARFSFPVGMQLLQVNEKFHILERVYRDCIKGQETRPG